MRAVVFARSAVRTQQVQFHAERTASPSCIESIQSLFGALHLGKHYCGIITIRQRLV